MYPATPGWGQPVTRGWVLSVTREAPVLVAEPGTRAATHWPDGEAESGTSAAMHSQAPEAASERTLALMHSRALEQLWEALAAMPSPVHAGRRLPRGWAEAALNARSQAREADSAHPEAGSRPGVGLAHLEWVEGSRRGAGLAHLEDSLPRRGADSALREWAADLAHPE